LKPAVFQGDPLISEPGAKQGLLIINADDWGGWRSATDAALACFAARRITSATAMVFMDDSERAAKIAGDNGLDVGLHINFNQPFTRRNCPAPLLASHERIGRFLRGNKYAQLIYHPGLRADFRADFQAQLEEFERCYGHAPSHFDGHQHMHLCSNALLGGIIPAGQRVRRSFSFWPGEKNALNRAYRRWVDGRLKRRYGVTDYFFALAQCLAGPRLARVAQLAGTATVELMTHPEKPEEQACLMSERFGALIGALKIGPYSDLQFKEPECGRAAPHPTIAV
jgi:predicted glycoside hydrolase/deacetylase ChbG (UPF0249 family)